MNVEQHYTGLKEMSGMLKTMFRNQAVFVGRTAKQTDLKANMLISLSFYILLGIVFIYLSYATYLHFSLLLLIIPCVLAFLSIVECIYIVAPNARMRNRIINKEMRSQYPDDKFHNLYMPDQGNLMATEHAVDAMLEDHELQLGNIIRGHFVYTRYISNKYKHLERAYNYFLATLGICFLLFSYNIIVSGGTFQEHDERSAYSNYRFDDPSSIHVLDKKLLEISGLGYNAEENVLYTINDEKGIIYKLNPKNGEIVDDYKFAKRGDYEGIELINNDILVTNSSGDIYISSFQDNKAIVQHTPLNEDNNIEGMAYDPINKRILLAGKGKPWLPIEGEKAIYSYNSNLHRMDSIVFLDIKIADLIACVDTIYNDDLMIKSLSNRLTEFAPSAIAIDPSNQDIYILTAHGSILVVYDKTKTIRDVIHLDELHMPQPEGLCFDSKNNLYISTEGHGGLAKIFVYNKR